MMSWAQYNLASCFEEGRGTSLNLEQALDYYKKAASTVDPRFLYKDLAQEGVEIVLDKIKAQKKVPLKDMLGVTQMKKTIQQTKDIFEESKRKRRW